ncbi:MAG: LPS export ABC transporter periplasmic protein LptC [Microscillaceae bacterium]|nr:LPS export ABC transporter periplasmic protein LptC [Microscillaceae bacterium]MDW8461617.1 LPS export ABC transporter periplasmic protein LptC [Cytophagales bacterium]
MTIVEEIIGKNKLILALLCAYIWGSCQMQNNKQLKDMPKYEGAIITTQNLKTAFSDSGKVKIRMEAPLQEEFADGNQVFRKGVVLNFYDQYHQNYARLTANYGKFDKAKNQYTAIGNVIVQNLKENKKLNTEELHWTPANQKIFTQKFVTITTPDEILKGEGLEAQQDFSFYKILRPTGTFKIRKQTKNLE